MQSVKLYKLLNTLTVESLTLIVCLRISLNIDVDHLVPRYVNPGANLLYLKD